VGVVIAILVVIYYIAAWGVFICSIILIYLL
jgi:hypothetical protein